MSDYLAEALKPFEKLARFWLERDGISDIDDDAECATHIRFADLRAASAALSRWESERAAGDGEVEAIRAERDRAQLACQQIAERLSASEARAEAAEAKLAEALLNPVSAAPSPAPDEVERVARALLREEIESYRESDVLLDEHIQWWKDGNDNLESCVHYSSIGLAMRRARAAISALRPAPTLTEEERAIWGVWVDYNRAPPGSYACLVSSFVNEKWSEPEARWMPAQGRPQLDGKIRVMPHLMPGDPLIDKLTEAG